MIMSVETQLDLFAHTAVVSITKQVCDGHIGFHSNAHVPGGLFCSNCDMIVMRDLPPPKNQPEIIGYVSATWAWKYEHGNEWSNDLEGRAEEHDRGH